MILASESFMKAKVQKAELDRQEVERKKLEIQALKDNAEYYCENYITKKITEDINQGRTSVDIDIIYENWKNKYFLVQNSHTCGIYNNRSKAYYEVPTFKAPFNFEFLKNYLIEAGYKIIIENNAFKIATSRTGMCTSNDNGIILTISWAEPQNNFIAIVIE